MEKKSEERREFNRVEIETPVKYSNANAFFYEYIKNISLGGTFIKTSTFLPVGTRFKFLIQLPGSDSQLTLNAEVVWIREREEESPKGILPQGMGIRFVFESEEEERRFKKNIEDLIRRHFGDRIAERLLK
jgi:uncharacterized protein (TIGR02266 family)